MVNNVSKALVNRLTVKFAGEILQDTNRYDLYTLFADLFLPAKERISGYIQGIQSDALSKLRSGAGDAKTDDKVDNKLKAAYSTKYRIPLDHEILRDHGVSYLQALAEPLSFEISLAPSEQVVVGSDENDLDYALKNLEPEYEVVRNSNLAESASSVYQSGKMFFYDHVTLHKSLTIKKDTDAIINETINVPRRSMKGILLLFVKPYAAGTRDSEKILYPELTSVRVTIDGFPNKIYSKGLQVRDFWDEASRFFFRQGSSEYSEISALHFYAGNRFGQTFALRTTTIFMGVVPGW